MNHIHLQRIEEKFSFTKNKVLFQTGPEKSTTEYFHLCTCCAVRDKSRTSKEMDGILPKILFLEAQVRGLQ